MITYLAGHPLVERVNSPQPADHPDHALYQKYFPRGGGSIFTFDIRGGQPARPYRFIDHLRCSLCWPTWRTSNPWSSTLPPPPMPSSPKRSCWPQGIRPGTIRLSIGSEHIDDILADLEQAFSAVEAQSTL